MILEEIFAFGHKNISCSHSSTIELTKDSYVTNKGNCILGLKATIACSDLKENTKKKIRNGEKITIVIKVDNKIERFHGYGNKNLKLLNENEMVFRKSDFICDRTVLIKCSKASNDLNREIINKIRNNNKRFLILFIEDNEF
jgi:hypothetical protein